MSRSAIDFDTLMDQYYQPIYWYIRHQVADHQDAQDILQETFIRAFRSFWKLRDQSLAQAWIYRIATNEINRWWKKKSRFATDEEMVQKILLSLEDPGYVDMSRKEAIAIHKGMTRLTPLQKEVFTLRYYDDLPYEEIAYITDSSIASLKTSYSAAKKIILQYVQE